MHGIGKLLDLRWGFNPLCMLAETSDLSEEKCTRGQKGWVMRVALTSWSLSGCAFDQAGVTTAHSIPFRYVIHVNTAQPNECIRREIQDIIHGDSPSYLPILTLTHLFPHPSSLPTQSYSLFPVYTSPYPSPPIEISHRPRVQHILPPALLRNHSPPIYYYVQNRNY